MLLRATGSLLMHKPPPLRLFVVHKSQAVRQFEPDCSLLSVNGSHMLTESLLLLIDSTKSCFFFSCFHTSRSCISTRTQTHTHTHLRRQFPLCRKIDGMFPNHRCCSTCESFASLTTQSRPTQLLPFLHLFPSGDYQIPKLCNNKPHEIEVKHFLAFLGRIFYFLFFCKSRQKLQDSRPTLLYRH